MGENAGLKVETEELIIVAQDQNQPTSNYLVSITLTHRKKT